jgi:hypothetical protein
LERKIILISELILFLFLALVIIFLLYVNAHSYSYEVKLESGQMQLTNPARGFYTQLGCNNANLLESLAEKNQTLVLAAYDLGSYRDCALSQEKLDELTTFLSRARELQIKCIFRAAYGFDILDSNDADSFQRIKDHIGQIAPVLNQYKDTIYCVQAGFFGPWGEWHTSKYLENNSAQTQMNNRNQLLKLLLTNLDDSIILNVRRPRFIRDAQKAGIDITRIGFHDDGLLASDNDLGTYDDADYDREAEMTWLHNSTVGVNGGEMPSISAYTDAANVVKEFNLMQISYLNSGYNTQVLDDWKTQTWEGENAYDYINNHLGYRFYVKKIKYRESWRKITLTATLENEGFAPITTGFQASFILRSEDGTETVIPIETKPETIKGGKNRRLEVTVPEEFRKTSFQIGLKIEDTADTRNLVEFSNSENSYENGVNYLTEIIRKKQQTN